MGKILRALIFIILLTILPFILLIRISVYAHVHYQLSAYTCLLVGLISTVALLILYFTVIHQFLTGRVGDYAGIKRRSIIALLIVMLYGFHALFFISSGQVKSQDLRLEFLEMHPLLRLSTSTLAYMDESLVMTDAQRVPEDYVKMGLPSKSSSLHYKQKDGYVYALDVRVKGRSELRNMFVTVYYRFMGFKTLRHGGTADHLHISLYNHEKPNAR